MKKHLWIPLVAILIIPVFVVLFSLHVPAGSSVNGVLVTGIASLDSILSSSAGKPVLINFWATWCGPCVREMPLLEQLATELGEEAVFIAVDMGDPELSTLELFRENNPIGITVVWLSTEEAGVLADRYELADALPMTLILNGSGEETARAIGARSSEWFASAMAGASSGTVEIVEEGMEIHIYVVGPAADPVVKALILEATAIAGASGFDVIDPTVPEDSIAMAEAYLPDSGWPYAQLCVGGACNRPVGTPEELRSAFESMR
ncbi:MAG: TlpA disulfide reductase family protein [Candidatus Fermentibacteria bacterium]|nr:TlpA disulfide reductase family protein [Candidatus Fermentibacteria bacterium]